MNKLLVGVLTPESAEFLSQLMSGSPIRHVESPLLFLSSPSEVLSKSSPFQSGDFEKELSVGVFTFRSVYNPSTKLTEFCCLVGQPESSYENVYPLDRSGFGLDHKDPSFIPYFALAFDPNRNGSSKAFLRSIGDALSKPNYTLNFRVFSTEDPEVKNVFNQYVASANFFSE